MDLKNGYTIGILGAGTMGTAVVNSTLNAVARGNGFDVRVPLPGRFLAAVSSEKSAARLREAYGSKIEVIVGDNNRLVRESDIVVLGMKPFMAQSILSKVDTCSNKTVISLLAGKTIEQLRELTDNSNIIARAMTNTPSKIGHGMTVVSLPEDIEIPDSVHAVIEWIFNNTGRCIFLAEKYQDVATALCGSGPAFMYLVLEALCDGAVRMGMPYDVAKECASQVLIGAGKMVQEGGHPASLRTAVCTPGGTTIGGLLKMEDAGVRAGVARAVEEAANIATALGKK